MSDFRFLLTVALNYQTPGLMTDLYDGKFHQNGQCGYVLKPAIMREGKDKDAVWTNRILMMAPFWFFSN